MGNLEAMLGGLKPRQRRKPSVANSSLQQLVGKDVQLLQIIWGVLLERGFAAWRRLHMRGWEKRMYRPKAVICLMLQ